MMVLVAAEPDLELDVHTCTVCDASSSEDDPNFDMWVCDYAFGYVHRDCHVHVSCHDPLCDPVSSDPADDF